MTAAAHSIYVANTIKRHRATKTEIVERRSALYRIIEAMRPMTVRQVFYQATVQELVEKSEAGYRQVQADLVHVRRYDGMPYDWLADSIPPPYGETTGSRSRGRPSAACRNLP
jgi:hypothetical protein